VEETQTPWLLLTDCDVRHQPDAVERGLSIARKSGAAMVSFSPEQEMKTWWERATIPFVYARLAGEYPYERVSDPEDPVAAANGQWLLVSRVAYDAVGGHAAVKDEILEDVALARRLKRSGCRLHFAPGAGIARTRMYRSLRQMYEGWSKNLFLLFDRRKSAVLGALVGAGFDSLAWLLLLVALWGTWQGWPVSRLILILLLGVVGIRHVRYLFALRRSRFPLWCAFYYSLGSVLFAALLLESASKYLSGEPLRWKGRDYAVPTK
jgi:hypothetical protein